MHTPTSGLTKTLEARILDSGWLLSAENRQSFARILSACLAQREMTAVQLAELLTNSPFNRGEDGIPILSRESNLKKAGRWTKGEQVPKDRDLLFQTCILLKLSAVEARALFEKGLQAGWVYAASREELIYGFCIECGLDIEAAYGLIKEGKEEAVPDMVRRQVTPDHVTVVRDLTSAIGSEYHQLCVTLNGAGNMTVEQRLSHFRTFLEEKADFFHSCSVSRWKAFMELFNTFAQVETTEDRMDAYGEIHTVKVNPNNITELADGLRLMRLPDPGDIDDLEEKRLDAAGQRRMEKMLDDDRLGDKNPIRKDITKYIAGEKDVPRDILIKTYILVHEAQQASRYDLDSLLVSAGYPPIYVRAASGLDALACYLLFDPEGNTDAYAEYKDEILRLRRDLARQLGRTDRLQEAAEEKAEKKHNRMLERLGQLIQRR